MAEASVMREVVKHCPVCGAPERTELYPRADVVQCAGCDVLYVSPRPTDATIATFYSALGRYDHWDSEPGRAQMWERRVERVRRHTPSGRLLDVGTGQGDFGAYAKKFFEFEGTEISSEGARLGRERHRIVIHEGDLLDLPLARGAYDIVTLWHVLEHVGNPRAVVERCRDLLRPGGDLVIAVPNADEDWQLTRRRWDAAIQFALNRPARQEIRLPLLDHALWLLWGRMPLRGINIPRLQLTRSEEEIHLTHFTLDTLAQMLCSVGMSVVERGIDDHSPERGLKARLRHNRHIASYRLTGRAAANAIFIAARKAG